MYASYQNYQAPIFLLFNIEIFRELKFLRGGEYLFLFACCGEGKIDQQHCIRRSEGCPPFQDCISLNCCCHITLLCFLTPSRKKKLNEF